MKLDPSESFNNQGNLRVDLLDAADLPSADRNGFSDPFCRFSFQGKEVHKSKVQKKTLHPAWNEFFEMPVRSRTAANFEVTVWDWDLGDRADFLGKAAINLDILQPFQRQEVVLGLDGKSGTIRLAMLFKPDYVIRSRQGSSTFSGTFSTPGKIVGAPVKGVGKGAVFVGGGVAKGASLVSRGFGLRGKKDKAGSEVPILADDEKNNGTMVPNDHDVRTESPVPPLVRLAPSTAEGMSMEKELPATPSNRRSRSLIGAGGASPSMSESGTATISIVSATGFPGGTHLQARVLHDSTKGLREVLKTKAVKTKTGDVNWAEEKHLETEKVPSSADAQFRLAVYDHSTFGSSKDLGEALFFVDDQGTGGEKTVKVGSGAVVVRSSFEPAPSGAAGLTAGSPDTASIISGSTAKDSPAGKPSTLRKSFIGRKERNITPG